MFTFSFDISGSALVFFGVAVLMIIPLVIVYMRPLWRVRNAVVRESADETEPRADIPVSIIVYAADEAEMLENLLPSILNQRYNAPFEVIVVNEGDSDATTDVVERLKKTYGNVYLTYTPDGAHQLSRKKLALMIGIKAARYPVVVQTVASAGIDSDLWLARMTEPFSKGSVEVVLGAGVLDTEKDSGRGRLGRRFNSIADDLAWMSAALDGYPYRGTELNLAYTRDVFFRNRGFSRSLNLKFGDDDIFINEISNSRNTAVVLHRDAHVRRNTWNVRRTYRELRARYNFTGRRIKSVMRIINAAGNWFLWIIIVLCILGALAMLPNALGICIALVMIGLVLALSALLWRRTLEAMTGAKLSWAIAWSMLMRPFANLFSDLKSRGSGKNNYTWIK